MQEISLRGAAATARLARSLAGRLTGRELLLLEGDLGAGKTTFVRHLAEALGIEPAWVSSPSFTLVQRYPAGRAGFGLAHADLYRLPPGSDLEPLGLEDLLSGPDLVVVEWPAAGEALGRECGRPVVRIRLQVTGASSRRAILQEPNGRIGESAKGRRRS